MNNIFFSYFPFSWISSVFPVAIRMVFTFTTPEIYLTDLAIVRTSFFWRVISRTLLSVLSSKQLTNFLRFRFIYLSFCSQKRHKSGNISAVLKDTGGVDVSLTFVGAPRGAVFLILFLVGISHGREDSDSNDFKSLWKFADISVDG